MELDPTLFSTQPPERLGAELVEKARIVMDTDDPLALSNLFQLVNGVAGHTMEGLISAGFPETEAAPLAWQAAWDRLRKLVDQETHFTHELAAYMERNISIVNPDAQTSNAGEPLDPATRTFYRTFIDCVEHPAVHATAAWLFEET